MKEQDDVFVRQASRTGNWKGTLPRFDRESRNEHEATRASGKNLAILIAMFISFTPYTYGRCTILPCFRHRGRFHT